MVLPLPVQAKVVPGIAFHHESQPAEHSGTLEIVRDVIGHYPVDVHFFEDKIDRRAYRFGHIALPLVILVETVSQIAKLSCTPQDRCEIHRCDYTPVVFSFCLAKKGEKTERFISLVGLLVLDQAVAPMRFTVEGFRHEGL